MRRFHFYLLTFAIGLLIGVIFTERRHILALRAADDDPHFRHLQLDTQRKRVLYPEFDKIMRDIEEKFGNGD